MAYFRTWIKKLIIRSAPGDEHDVLKEGKC